MILAPKNLAEIARTELRLAISFDRRVTASLIRLRQNRLPTAADAYPIEAAQSGIGTGCWLEERYLTVEKAGWTKIRRAALSQLRGLLSGGIAV